MNIKKQAISGVKWTTVATITIAISALLKISVLARFLDASDFGLMALITFVLGFMDLFMDMGLTSAILHKQSITKQEYASLYWLNVGFSIFLLALIIFLSPFIADFYNESELNNLIPLAGLGIVFSAIGRQYKTVLQKELQFKKIAIIDIGAVIIGLILAVILAMRGLGVYALVYAALAQYCIGNVTYLIFGNKKQKLMFHFNFKETKPFLKIGIYQVGGQAVNYFNRDLDVLIIGKFFGSELLGGYSLAKQLVRRPISIIDTVVNKVAISILPRYQTDNNSLVSYFNNLISGLSCVNAFVYGAIAVTAPLIITVLYGDEFLSIVDLVRVFTIVVYFRSISGLIGVLSITKGRTDIEFYWNLIIMIIFPIVILIGVNINLIGVVALIALAQTSLIFPSWYMFYKRLLDLPFIAYIKKVFSPFILSVIVFSGYSAGNNTSFEFQIIWLLLLFVVLLVYALLTEKKFKKIVYNYKKKYVKFFTGSK